jgi:hypothetical protein
MKSLATHVVPLMYGMQLIRLLTPFAFVASAGHSQQD